MVKPYTRWTADTEAAFLLALEVTGLVRAAAERIGRSVASAYKRRSRDVVFAAKWDAVVAKQQADWIGKQGAERAVAEPVPAHERLDGWTKLRQRAFLRALCETGEVKAACERVKISDSAVYKLKKRSPDFARAFDAALERSAPMLEQIAWERAVEGWEEPVVVKGEVVGTRRVYSEALLRTLLAGELKAREAERVEFAKNKPVYRTETREATDATMRTLLDRLNVRGRAMRREALLEVERVAKERGFSF